VGLTSILTANEAINILLKKKEITVAPRYLYIDLMEQRFVVGNMQTADRSSETFQI
jgi:hypothetical protein